MILVCICIKSLFNQYIYVTELFQHVRPFVRPTREFLTHMWPPLCGWHIADSAKNTIQSINQSTHIETLPLPVNDCKHHLCYPLWSLRIEGSLACHIYSASSPKSMTLTSYARRLAVELSLLFKRFTRRCTTAEIRTTNHMHALNDCTTSSQK